jgi:hypothetical protein
MVVGAKNGNSGSLTPTASKTETQISFEAVISQKSGFQRRFGGRMPDPFQGITGPQSLLILAPDAFLPAIQPLVIHKNNTGMSTIAISVEDIVTGLYVDNPNSDTPARIKRAILYAHDKLSTRFVMLVGDASQFPVRFWFLRDDVPTYPGTTHLVACVPSGTYVQSDLYYANLYHHGGMWPQLTGPNTFDDWDQNGDGFYNEAWMSYNTSPTNPIVPNASVNPDNVDGYPDVAVGRVPAGSAAEVTTYVNKVIAYESRIRHQRPRNLLAFTFIHDQQYGFLDFSTKIALNSGLAGADWADRKFVLIENEGLGPNPGTPYSVPPPSPFVNATPAQTSSYIGRSDWVSYVGHGGSDHWGGRGVFDEGAVDATSTLTGMPVVYAVGCKTALFMTNVPWDGPFLDVDGNMSGPYSIDPSAKPNHNGPVIHDGNSPGKTWGVGTGFTQLPVTIPSPGALNVNNDCLGHTWTIESAPGGGIVYIGEHCETNDMPGSEMETSVLTGYHELAAAGYSIPVLGDMFLRAQQAYWANHIFDGNSQSLDYHSIPRLFLGWVVYFGDPSLRMPIITDFKFSEKGLSLAVYKDELHLGFVSSADNMLQTCTFADWRGWCNAASPGQGSYHSPAIADFDGKLWMASIDPNTQLIRILYTTNGLGWMEEPEIPGSTSLIAPAITAFDNALWLAFVEDDTERKLRITSSGDWSTSKWIAGASSAHAPSLVVFKDTLWVAFLSNDSQKEIRLCQSSSDGSSWKPSISMNHQKSMVTPSLCTFKGQLWAASVLDDGSDVLVISSSPNGTSWSIVASLDQGTSHAPSLRSFDGRLRLAYIADDGSNRIFLSSSKDGMNWTAGSNT